MSYKRTGEIRQWIGLSTDTKPTANMEPGYEFYEEDTGKTYVYNSAGSWTIKEQEV